MSTPTTSNQLGGLYIETSTGQELVFPLKHTKVQAKIAGNLSRVEVIQSFENPFDQPLEAIYIFPLPDQAAVDEMTIKIGNTVIKGNIKKKAEAQEIYERAKKQGRTAGLLTQARDNIFTQSLTNIQPGEQIDITIHYTDSLKFSGGNYEFVLPMVVGPRYIPSGDTDRVADASQITPPVLPPTMISPHHINVSVEIDAGLPILNIISPSHKLQIKQTGEIIQVILAEDDAIANQDFILRYQVAGRGTQSTIITQTDKLGGHFAIYLIPALDYQPTEIVAKDLVFLIDTSGSQNGAPLQQCQELMRRFINGLNPDDTFTIIDFSETTRQLSSHPLGNTPENRATAIHYINQLHADGGTELLNGIHAVMKFPEISPKLRSIILLTDGFIGNEKEILAEVQRELKPGNRLYSFGAGSSVNRFFLNRIAEIGRGISTIIRHDEPIHKIVEDFYHQINKPVLTNIQVTWSGTGVEPVIYPGEPPDLFASQPLVLFGRQQYAQAGNLLISGVTAEGKVYEKNFALNFGEVTGNPAIAQLWGRAKIKDLTNLMFSCDTKTGVEAITDTALTYQLLCEYTAFVAVSEEVRVNPEGASISVEVPLPLPTGMSHPLFLESEDFLPGMFLRSASPAPQHFSQAISFAKPRIKESEMGLEALELELLELETDDLQDFSSGEDIPGENSPAVEVISITGLDADGMELLTQYLKQLDLPMGLPGEVVFEFMVNQGRVEKVVLDAEASILTDIVIAVAKIRRSLLAWLPPKTAQGLVRIVLHINF